MPDAIPDALQRKLDTLPDAPGVYLWKDAQGNVLYVGKAKRLKSRVRSYFSGDSAASVKNIYLQRHIADVETIVVNSEAQSLLLENNLIKEYQPRFNVRLKDDKSYPSIAVTLGEPFPRVLVTRRRDIAGARYFGPYTDVALLRKTLAIVRRLYTVRSCHDDLPRERRERPCLDYYIGRCRAPCVGWQTVEDYRLMIDEVVDFLEGRTVDVRGKVREAMLAASGRQDYERAGLLRDQLKWLEQIESPAGIEVLGTGDADVVGYARDGDDAVGVFLRVREGRVIARDHAFLENLAEESDDRILEFLMVRSYVPMQGRVRRLVLPFPPADVELLQEILPETEWNVPTRGTARRWLDLADQNARHLMESLRIESFETDERAGDPVYLLAAQACLRLDDRARAAKAAAGAEAIAEDSGARWLWPEIRRIQAEAETDLDPATGLLLEAQAAAQRQGARVYELRAIADLLLRNPAAARARSFDQRAQKLLADFPDPGGYPEVHRLEELVGPRPVGTGTTAP